MITCETGVLILLPFCFLNGFGDLAKLGEETQCSCCIAEFWKQKGACMTICQSSVFLGISSVKLRRKLSSRVLRRDV